MMSYTGLFIIQSDFINAISEKTKTNTAKWKLELNTETKVLFDFNLFIISY